MAVNLDPQFLALCTPAEVKRQFHLYKILKTDELSDDLEVRIQVGVDGVTAEAFESELTKHTANMAERLRAGRFHFAPFREEIRSKDPTMSLKKAKGQDKTRTLSVACIRDVLVQRILHQVLANHFEAEVFTVDDALDKVSFGYRTGKSAPIAARATANHIANGYCHVLDADIEKFFDRIPHGPLIELLGEYLDSNSTVYRMLVRFIRADRVEERSYGGNPKRFHRMKPRRLPREIGIPQGGVLSGLLANLYLHRFDRWVVKDLNENYNIRYVRYADDFLILAQDQSDLGPIKEAVRERLSALHLTLHPDDTKTRFVDLTQKGTYVEFVGFRLSPTGIRVRSKNLRKFKYRFHRKLYERIPTMRFSSALAALKWIIEHRLNFKIEGLHAAYGELPRCPRCAQTLPMRSWISFFATVTDVQQFRALDTWIRKMIQSFFYHRYGVRVSRQNMNYAGLMRLALIYRHIRRELSKATFCSCEPGESKAARLVGRAHSTPLERETPTVDLLSELAGEVSD
jgi:RNA-directed DNA polymerase